MTLLAAHDALTTVLTGATLAGVDEVFGYEDPNLPGQGRTVVTVSFGKPVMDPEKWNLAIRIYASWANSFPESHSTFLKAIQSVDDALGATYPRLTWDSGVDEHLTCWVATAEVAVGRQDF